MVQVLGINHKLHVRKILVSREKLRPLNQQEEKYKDIVLNEVRTIVQLCSVFISLGTISPMLRISLSFIVIDFISSL